MCAYESVNINKKEDKEHQQQGDIVNLNDWLHDKFKEPNEITILSTSLLSFIDDGSNAR